MSFLGENNSLFATISFRYDMKTKKRFNWANWFLKQSVKYVLLTKQLKQDMKILKEKEIQMEYWLLQLTGL